MRPVRFADVVLLAVHRGREPHGATRLERPVPVDARDAVRVMHECHVHPAAWGEGGEARMARRRPGGRGACGVEAGTHREVLHAVAVAHLVHRLPLEADHHILHFRAVAKVDQTVPRDVLLDALDPRGYGEPLVPAQVAGRLRRLDGRSDPVEGHPLLHKRTIYRELYGAFGAFGKVNAGGALAPGLEALQGPRVRLVRGDEGRRRPYAVWHPCRMTEGRPLAVPRVSFVTNTEVAPLKEPSTRISWQLTLGSRADGLEE
jgi:hypothetical protein